jgi:predicted RND superfamily exporter protein
METFIKFVLRFRWFVLLFFFGVTIFFGSFLRKAAISSSPGELFFGESPKYQHYIDRNKEFGGDNIALIAFKGDDLLTVSTFSRLHNIVDTLETDPEIERVDSLVSVQHIESIGDVLHIDYYEDLFNKNPLKKNELLKTLTTDPLTKDLIITPDGRNSMMAIEFSAGDTSMESLPDKIDRIYHAFKENGFQPKDIYRGGLISVMAEVIHQAILNLLRFLPITAVVLVLMVYLMFHRVWPVLLTVTVTSVAIVWTLGLGIILYGHLNIFTTMIPAIMLITCFADVIHLCSAYLLELSRGESKKDAIHNIGKEVGTACGYTSITTFCGFIAIAIVPAPVFRQAGFLLGFGVATALFMALTLVPIFLSIFPQPKPWRVGKTTAVQMFLDRILDWAYSLTMKRPRTIIAAFAILFIISGYSLFSIHFETRFSKRFDSGNPIRVSLKYMGNHFPGTNVLDIYLQSNSRDDLLNPDVFRNIAELEAYVEGLPRVAQVTSVVDLVKKLYKQINPDMASMNPLPTTREALAQLLLLFEMSGGDNLDRLMDSDYTIARLNARLIDTGVIETSTIGHDIIQKSEALFGSSVSAEALSLEFLSGEWVDNIIDGQRRGLLLAFSLIGVLMIIAMRSIRIGLISMIPNALPLIVLLGYLGMFWDDVDTDTLIILMIAIGIGVDDTIHFLMRLRFEFRKTTDKEKALRLTLNYAGRAIIITSIILVAGFAPFSGSDYFSVEIMGTLLPFSLATALVADLFLVPAFVKMGWIRF